MRFAPERRTRRSCALNPRGMRHAHVTPGVEYDVHALGVFDGHVSFLIVDDRGEPSWDTAWVFDQVDSTIPDDWICSVLREGPELLMGPDFIARDWHTYGAFAECEPEPLRLFWKRFDAIRSEWEAAIPDQWRALGFYFTFDVQSRVWLVAGSRAGLLKFCQMLTDYASIARAQHLPGFQRLGPRQDMKLTMAKSPQVLRDGLHGRPEDFERLANIIKSTLPSGQATILLASTFSNIVAPYQVELVFRVGPDDFDPGIDGPAMRATGRQ